MISAFLCCKSSNLDIMIETSTSINRAWGEGSTCYRTVRRWFKKFQKPKLHQQKIIVTVWWSAIGVIHYRFLETNHSITAEIYFNKPASLQKKMPAWWMDVVQFCSTITRGHMLEDWFCRNSQTQSTRFYHILHFLQTFAYWLSFLSN